MTDIKKYIREIKGLVTLETVAFEEKLPGQHHSTTTKNYQVDSDSSGDDDVGKNQTSARTRPFVNTEFKKRKLVHIANLHQISKKAARPRYEMKF